MTHLDIQQEATLPQCETAIKSDQFSEYKPSEIKQMLPWLRGANVVIPIMILLEPHQNLQGHSYSTIRRFSDQIMSTVGYIWSEY